MIIMKKLILAYSVLLIITTAQINAQASGRPDIYTIGNGVSNSTFVVIADDNFVRFYNGTGTQVGDDVITIAEHSTLALPKKYAIENNYPNPFNATTTIEYSVSKDTNITISILNISGQRVKVVEDSFVKAGTHFITWDASDMSSGTYFCKISSDGFSDTKKMMLMKWRSFYVGTTYYKTSIIPKYVYKKV